MSGKGDKMMHHSSSNSCADCWKTITFDARETSPENETNKAFKNALEMEAKDKTRNTMEAAMPKNATLPRQEALETDT